MNNQFKQIYEQSIQTDMWRNNLNSYRNYRFKQIYEQLI